MADYEAPTCDVCGAPATSRAVDIVRHEFPAAEGSELFKTEREPSATRIESREHGAPKYGCDEHPAEIQIHRTQLPPSLWLNR